MNRSSTPAPELVTERLRLRRWQESDAALLTAMSADPLVTRYIGEGRPWSSARAEVVAAGALAHWRERGFGWRTITLASTATGRPAPPPDRPTRPNEPERKDTTRPLRPGDVLGFVMLSRLGPGAAAGLAADEFELGWWLWPWAWGRGYASEAAAAVRDEAFDRLSAPSTVARILPANAPSRAVADAIEMRYEGTTTGRYAEPIVIYRADAPAGPRSPVSI